MANSIQDQLRRAGLANKKQEVRARKAKNNKEKLKRSGIEVLDEASELVRVADETKLEKDRKLNLQITDVAHQKAIHAQIIELVNLNKITERGDVDFRFTDGDHVKTFSVAEHHRQAMVRGALAIVKVAGNTDIVPRKVAEKIAERDSSALLLCNDIQQDDGEEDEYADFKVPDDLMW